MDQSTQNPNQMGQSKKSDKSKIVIFIVAIFAVVAGGGYYAYYMLSKNGAESIINSATNKVAESECKYNDKDLCKFIFSWKDEEYITMNGTTTDKDGKVSTWLMKMQGEAKSQMTSSDQGEEKYNTITIDNVTYTKDYSDNKWFKSTLSSETDSSNDYIKNDVDFDEKEASAEDKTTYQKIGIESCGKWSCFKYQVIDPQNNESTEYIYFDNEEYLLRKMRTEDNDGAITEIIYDYSKFSISEPSPIKEGSPFDSISGNTENTVNSSAIDNSEEDNDSESDYSSSLSEDNVNGSDTE